MALTAPKPEHGPFNIHQIKPGDRHELSNGNAYYCGPTGGDGARRNGVGFEVLDTDPMVESAGIDAGFAFDEHNLRAPDIAVGNVPDKPGWIRGAAPPLAVEYAGSGQDEAALQMKIGELLERGTRFIWVVRLVGPRRVEVYEPSTPMKIAKPGDMLVAEGVLQNPVQVDALFDRAVAHDAALRNLLQRRGYDDLDDVREEARDEGRDSAQKETLILILQARGIAPSSEVAQRIQEANGEQVQAWLRLAANATTLEEVFGRDRMGADGGSI